MSDYWKLGEYHPVLAHLLSLPCSVFSQTSATGLSLSEIGQLGALTFSYRWPYGICIVTLCLSALVHQEKKLAKQISRDVFDLYWAICLDPASWKRFWVLWFLHSQVR